MKQTPAFSPSDFSDFGSFLKYLRRRAQLTQTELAIACGYSTPHISHLENNQRVPDQAALLALFVPALSLEHEPELVARLLELAKVARGEQSTRSAETKQTIPAPVARFINALPLDVRSDAFRDRASEQAKVTNWLLERRRVISIYGRAGVGKTALACHVLADMERAPADNRPDGMVYLGAGVNSATGISLDRILNDFSRLLTEEARTAAEQVWRDPTTSNEQRVSVLLDSLKGGRYILLLDNLETHQHPETHDFTDPTLEALFHVVLERGGPISVLVTSRYPLNLPNRLCGYEQKLPLEEGLPLEEAIVLIRNLDDGETALPAADDDPLLVRIIEATGGFPRALEALVGYLKGGSLRTLSELVADRRLLAEEVTSLIVREAIQQLTSEAVCVLEGLALLGRPATHSALEYLLAPYTETSKLRLVIDQLVNSCFVQHNRAVHTFALHPIDREYCLERIPVGSPNDAAEGLFPPLTDPPEKIVEVGEHHRLPPYTRYALNYRAAMFFERQRKPQSEWKTLDDLAPQLAEFEYRIRAEDYDTAARLLKTFDVDCLRLWGQWQTMLALHKQLEGKIKDKNLLISCLSSLGRAYYSLGEVQRAIAYHEQGLTIAREIGDRQGQGAALGSLGNAYYALGEVQKAIGYYEQRLAIAREIGDRRDEGYALGSLGNAYNILGEVQKAIGYYEQSLAIAREIGDRWGEGRTLVNLGNACHVLGEVQQVIGYFEQGLTIAREIGDRELEGIALENLGGAYSDLGDAQQAIGYYEQSLAIAREIGDRELEGIALENLGAVHIRTKGYSAAVYNLKASLEIYAEIDYPRGKHFVGSALAQVYLFDGHLTEARLTAETARQYDAPENAPTLASIYGCILMALSEREAAQAAFEECVTTANDLLMNSSQSYKARYARSLARAGLVLLAQETINTALDDYQAALRVFGGKGVVQDQLHLLETLISCPGGESLLPIRAVLVKALEAQVSGGESNLI